MAHQAGAYPGFCSMKWLGVFLLPPGWDDSPSQGYPPALSSPVPIYTPGWREALWEWSVLPKNTTQCLRPGLELGPLAPESSALTMRPPRLPRSVRRCIIGHQRRRHSFMGPLSNLLNTAMAATWKQSKPKRHIFIDIRTTLYLVYFNTWALR